MMNVATRGIRCVVGALAIVPLLSTSGVRAQTSSDTLSTQEASDLIGLLAHVSATWEHAQWRPILERCVRGEVENLRRQVAAEEARYGMFTSRARLDSAKAANEMLRNGTPVIARGRCFAKRATLLGFFAGRDGVTFSRDAEEVRRQELGVYEDWLPLRWEQVRAHMFVSGPDQFVRTGPWALDESTVRALTQARRTDDELERALAEAGNRFALDGLVLQPRATEYNNAYQAFAEAFGFVWKLAAAGQSVAHRTLVSQSTDPRLAGAYDQALAALGCRYFDRERMEREAPVGGVLFDICPTPRS